MKKSKTAKSKPSSPANSQPEAEPTHEEIAAAAYSLWQHTGCPEGRDVEHWLAAEAQLRQCPVKAGSVVALRAPLP